MTTTQVAAELGIHPSRVRRLAISRGLGTKITDRLWLFTAEEVEKMRTREPGRPRKPAPDANGTPTEEAGSDG